MKMVSTKISFITQQNDQYSLTKSGELEVYYKATKNLLQNYLSQVMGVPQDRAYSLGSNVESILREKFRTTDDFIEKISVIQNYIQETDTSRFNTFYSQHFLALVEKIQKDFLDEQITLHEQKEIQSFIPPAVKLLTIVQDSFLTAPKLKLPLEKEPEEPKEEEEVPDATKAPTVAEEGPGLLPGERLLQKIIPLFEKTKHISHGLHSSNVTDDHNFPRDVYKKSAPSQISLKDYLQVSNQVAAFVKMRDAKAYQEWFTTLLKKQKVILYVNQFLQAQAKGKLLNWNNQLSTLEIKLQMPLELVQRITYEVWAYKQLIPLLQHVLGLVDASHKQAIYLRIVDLLDKQGNSSEKKKSDLKIILLVCREDIRSELSRKVSDIIDIIFNIQTN